MKMRYQILFVIFAIIGCEDTELCPGHEDMIRLGGDSDWCIDRYESSLWSEPDCSGVLYGDKDLMAIDDYPAGFPDMVESTNCKGSCEEIFGTKGGGYQEIRTEPQTTAVYACSIPNVIPSHQMTWFQARRACENSGKVLCPKHIWYKACSKNGRKNYPYGGSSKGEDIDGYKPEICNVYIKGEKVLKIDNTGDNTKCEGGYSGLFDTILLPSVSRM